MIFECIEFFWNTAIEWRFILFCGKRGIAMHSIGWNKIIEVFLPSQFIERDILRVIPVPQRLSQLFIDSGYAVDSQATMTCASRAPLPVLSAPMRHLPYCLKVPARNRKGPLGLDIAGRSRPYLMTLGWKGTQWRRRWVGCQTGTPHS
jgi:hypothetical protein